MINGEQFEALAAWVMTDITSKLVDIKVNHKGIEAYAYNHKIGTGMFVKEDTDISRLDELIAEKVENELKKEYERLRNKFEYNKEGI